MPSFTWSTTEASSACRRSWIASPAVRPRRFTAVSNGMKARSSESCPSAWPRFSITPMIETGSEPT